MTLGVKSKANHLLVEIKKFNTNFYDVIKETSCSAIYHRSEYLQ